MKFAHYHVPKQSQIIHVTVSEGDVSVTTVSGDCVVVGVGVGRMSVTNH